MNKLYGYLKFAWQHINNGLQYIFHDYFITPTTIKKYLLFTFVFWSAIFIMQLCLKRLVDVYSKNC